MTCGDTLFKTFDKSNAYRYALNLMRVRN